MGSASRRPGQWEQRVAEAVEPLITALQDQHEQVREAAAKTLGIIGDRRALVPLNLALQDADEQVRKKAIEALGLLKQSGRDFR